MTGQDDKRDESLVAAMTEAIQVEVANLDGATRSRLNRSRQKALEEIYEGDQLSGWYRNWFPGGGLVAASLLIAAFWFGSLQIGGPVSKDALPVLHVPQATDLNLLMADDDFELLQDLEFYNWLQSVPGDSVG